MRQIVPGFSGRAPARGHEEAIAERAQSESRPREQNDSAAPALVRFGGHAPSIEALGTTATRV
jgi:hypothetical protein